MTNIFRFAVILLSAGLLRAEAPVYTSFRSELPLIHIARYSPLIPTIGFGPSASFDNPAYLASIYGQEISVSTQDFTHPLSLALSYGGRFLENASIGGGVSFYSKDGYLENHSIFSFASSGNDIDFGANIKFMIANKFPEGGYNKTLYAMDFDLGLLVGITPRIFMGAALFNLMSTPFLHTQSFSVSPERAAKIQIGGFLDHQRSTAIFAEGHADSLHDVKLKNYSFGGGGEMAFLKDLSLKLRAGCLSRKKSASPDQNIILLLALRYEFALAGNAIKTEYAFNNSFDKSGNADIMDLMSHYIQFSIGLGGREDFSPPIATVSLDNPSFSPDGDGHLDVVNTLIQCRDNPGGSGVKKWALTFCRKTGSSNKLEIIKAFTGYGLPPRIIAWDGRDSGKNLLPKGVYYYQFRVIDKVGNSTDSPPQPVHIE